MSGEALDHVEDVSQKGFFSQGEASLAGHVIGGVAHRAGRGNRHLGVEPEGGLLREKGGGGSIGDQRQVFVVLLGGAGGHDGGLEVSALEVFPNFLAGSFPQ